MSNYPLALGAGKNNRVIDNPTGYLAQYHEIDTGYIYQNYPMRTPFDRVVPEDLAVTLLVNSRVGRRAFQSLYEQGLSLDLSSLPNKPLEETTPEERKQVAKLISQLTHFPGFGASVATKVLHKKRPALIPILDNQAIFGAYMNPKWNPPSKPAPGESVKDERRISQALDWIAFDLTRPENAPTWEALQALEPALTRIQLFDAVWWMYFRDKQPFQVGG